MIVNSSPAFALTPLLPVAEVPSNVISVFVFAIAPELLYTTILACSPSLTTGSTVAVEPPSTIPVVPPPAPGVYVNCSPSITNESPDEKAGKLTVPIASTALSLPVGTNKLSVVELSISTISGS